MNLIYDLKLLLQKKQQFKTHKHLIINPLEFMQKILKIFKIPCKKLTNQQFSNLQTMTKNCYSKKLQDTIRIYCEIKAKFAKITSGI